METFDACAPRNTDAVTWNHYCNSCEVKGADDGEDIQSADE